MYKPLFKPCPYVYKADLSQADLAVAGRLLEKKKRHGFLAKAFNWIFKGAPYGNDNARGPHAGKLDKRFVDYKPDRSLSNRADTTPITTVLPKTSYIPYSRVPFLDAMHKQMGIGDPLNTPVDEYMAKRKALFTKQPVQDLPLDNMVVTQKYVNKDKIAEGQRRGSAAYGDTPIDAVKYKGKYYVMNGHHRAVTSGLNEAKTIRAKVLDLDTLVTKGAPFGNDNAAGPHKGYGKHTSAEHALATADAWAKDKLTSKVRGGDPLQTGYDHSLRISGNLTDPVHKIVGMLHDIVEDSDVTVPQIREAFGNRVADAVHALTKNKEQKEPIDVYLKRVMANVDALQVKIKDMQDNMVVRPGTIMGSHMKAKQELYVKLYPQLTAALAQYKQLKKMQSIAFTQIFKANPYHDELGWDYPQYSPHLTISYKAGDVDLSKIQPYLGTIELGPELYETLTTDYKTTVEYKSEGLGHPFHGNQYTGGRDVGKLYHLSTQENLDRISTHGFISSGKDAVHGAGVYLTTDPNFRQLPSHEVEVVGGLDNKVVDRPDGSKWVIVRNPLNVKIKKTDLSQTGLAVAGALNPDLGKKKRKLVYLLSLPLSKVFKNQPYSPPVYGFATVFKANPYHDAAGRFATANAHTFRSLGPAFERSTARARTAYAADSWATAEQRKLKNLFSQAQAQRTAALHTTPAQARADLRAKLVTERERLVRETVNHQTRDLVSLTEAQKQRLKNEIANPDTFSWVVDRDKARLAASEHFDALRAQGLTPHSTLATANRITAAMLAHAGQADAFAHALSTIHVRTPAQQAEARARAATQRLARQQVVGEQMFNMTSEERLAHMNTLSDSGASAARTAYTRYGEREALRIADMSPPDRAVALAAMTSAQRNHITDSMDWGLRTRVHVRDQAYAQEQATVARHAAGGYKGEELHRMTPEKLTSTLAGLTPEQRVEAKTSLDAYAASEASRLTTDMGHGRRIAALNDMTPEQRDRVLAATTPEQRAVHAEQAATYARILEARAKAQRISDQVETATLATLSPHALEVHRAMKDLQSRGMDIAGESNLAKSAARFSAHYPKVTPADIVDAVLGSGATIHEGRLRISPSGELSVLAHRGSTVHGSEVEDSVERTFNNATGDVHHDFMRLVSSARGGGSVKKQFAASLPLYQKMGMKTVSVYGALEGGRYAWARYGFNDQDPPAWKDDAMPIVKKAISSLGKLTPEAQKEATTIDSLVRTTGHTKEFPRLLTATKTPHLDAAWIAKGFGKRGTKSTLMSDSLQGGRWHGIIDMRDKAQMKHIADYVQSDLPVLSTSGSPEGGSIVVHTPRKRKRKAKPKA